MSITDILKQGEQFVKENSSTILTGVGVVGTVSTGVLAFRGGMRYEDIRLDKHDELNEGLDLENEQDREKYVTVDTVPPLTKLQWLAPHILPSVLIGGVTVTSIVLANRINSKKIATLAALYGLSEQRLKEYKDKTLEKVGKTKEQAIHDEVAQDRVNNAGNSEVVITGDGTVLCYDQFTGRHFNSTVETIKRAENRVNDQILNSGSSSLSSFYDEIGLPATSMTEELGWNSESTGLVDVIITSTISPDGRPCLAIDFCNMPKYDWVNRNYQ